MHAIPTAQTPPLSPAHVPVVLLGYPLALGEAQDEHQDTLVREFQLLVIGDAASAHPAPRRLLELAQEMIQRYHAELAGPAAARAAALDRGEEFIDLTYQAPPETLEVLDRWEETHALVDAYCSEGELLTLAAGPEIRELRRWAFHEFRAQLRGGSATSWQAWCARSSPEAITPVLEHDGAAGAHYLRLTTIPAGGAAHQRSVTSPTGSEIVLDFDTEGHLLGIEFLDPETLPTRSQPG